MKLLNLLLCMLIGTIAVILCACVGIFNSFRGKTLSIIFIIGILFTSCHGGTDTYERDDYNIVNIDGCQYIKIKSSLIAHKGNCNNPIHIYNSK